MATEIATEKLNKIRSGESLSQFEKDQLEYYGRVSGLTGKTNIPGTPLMVGGGTTTSPCIRCARRVSSPLPALAKAIIP